MLATGNVPVTYKVLPGGFKGTDETVKIMCQLAMGRYGARSPKIRALAANIIKQAGIREKDYRAEADALAAWVRDNIRYMKDVYGQETVSPPEEVAFNMGAGDCDDQSVLLAALLSAIGVPTRFKVMGLTPQMYSHVYLQALPVPAHGWVTYDPIMQDKPVGWEVPKSRRVIEKAYPVNGPDGWIDAGINGVNGMHGLGYVGDPRVVSPLEESTIPMNAGTGQRPPRSPAKPNYVSMPSMLDTDLPVDHLIHFHPNQNTGRRIGAPPTRDISPQLKRLSNGGLVPAHGPAGPPAGPIPAEAMHPAEQAAMEGYSDVIGPDALAGMSEVQAVNNQSVPAHMTAKTVMQAPEGVDNQFARAALVVNPNDGEKVTYHGMENLAEKPPIRPLAVMNGMGQDPRDMLPGMGYLGDITGPGLAPDSTGAEAPAPGQSVLPEGAATVTQPGMSTTTKTLLALGAAAGLGYLLMKKRR